MQDLFNFDIPINIHETVEFVCRRKSRGYVEYATFIDLSTCSKNWKRKRRSDFPFVKRTIVYEFVGD